MNYHEAKNLQEKLASEVVTHDIFGTVKKVGGVDIAFRGKTACAAVVVMSFPGMELLDFAVSYTCIPYPYIPGLLSFREIPCIVSSVQKLGTEPDLLLVDGHGLAHPRKFGLASHLGFLTEVPAIGCAKSRLVGDYVHPGPKKGEWEPLTHTGEVVGAVVRTRDEVKPVFVSIGYGVCLKSAVWFVLQCAVRYRLPEPVRYAHRAAKQGRLD